MSQSICAVEGPPIGLRVTLTCDRHPPGLLPPPTWTVDGFDYTAIRHHASHAGWKRTEGGIWLCPQCGR